MFYGQAQNKEKLEGFIPQDQNFQNIEHDMLERQQAFQGMNKEWDQLGTLTLVKNNLKKLF